MRLRLCHDLLCGGSGKEILTGALALAHTLEDGQTKLLDPPLGSVTIYSVFHELLSGNMIFS